MLPFKQYASVVHQGRQLGSIKLSVWQQPESRETATGQVWDWSGEAEIEAADLLVDQTNRQLFVVDSAAELDLEAEEPPGTRFSVLVAVRHDFLPHLQLRLARIRGG